MTNDRIVTGVKTLSGKDPWAQGQSFRTVEQLQAQIASLTAENERLRGALGFMLEAYSGPEIRMCCDGRECPCMGVTNYQEADRYALAALQPKEGE